MSRSDGREPRSGPTEPEHDLVVVSRQCYPVLAGAEGVDRDTLDRLALERVQRLVELAGRLGQLAPEGEAAEEGQCGLLAFGAVDGADAAGLEPELEQFRQRVGVLVAHL